MYKVLLEKIIEYNGYIEEKSIRGIPSSFILNANLYCGKEHIPIKFCYKFSQVSKWDYNTFFTDFTKYICIL